MSQSVLLIVAIFTSPMDTLLKFNGRDRRAWLRSYLENMALLHRQASITSSSVAQTSESEIS